jgi:hypothetical protein
VVKSWFDADGSLKPGAGALADPYEQEYKQRGQSPFRCERTRPNISARRCASHALTTGSMRRIFSSRKGPISAPSFPA